MTAHHKVAVLTHPRDKFESGSYHLLTMIDIWRKSDIEVAVLHGIGHFEAADALILHVDLTVIPGEYLAFSRRYPIVVNGRVHDISKRRISRSLVTAGDPYPGAVIVKTDLNHAGRAEQRAMRLWRLRRILAKCLPWVWTGNLTPEFYPVFPSLAAVPRPVWNDSRLVVERFIPEREGKYYCLRQWLFLGNRSVSQRLISPHPIVKASNVVRRDYDLPVPEALRTIREELGFDYGKFDYVIANGAVVLLDANRTPTAGRNTKVPRRRNNAEELAPGLASFLLGTGAKAS